MTLPLVQSITELLNASHDDIETTRLPVNDRTFGFHGQQAIEKLMKALIAAHGEVFEFTHDLNKLLQHLALLDEKIPVPPALLARLTVFAGRFRYQEPEAFADEERLSILRGVELLNSSVLARLAILLPDHVWPMQ